MPEVPAAKVTMSSITEQLATHDIHSYGSDALIKFESQMQRYFKREYDRWRGNKEPPESYGASSFEGSMTDTETHDESVEHYNKEFKLYQAFLDDEYMAYTMAYYGATDEDHEIDPTLSLNQAQQKKYKLLVDRAQIVDGQNILDLGCGFGGFAKYLLDRFPDITVTGINPSSRQSRYITDTLQLDSNRFNLVQKYIADVNDADLPPGSFNRIVSIGALEHFANFDLLFELLEKLLVPGGKCLHHLIVSLDTIPQFISAESTMMADYFPGGHIWPYAELQRHVRHLQLEDSWFVNGKNYWKTLDEWHRRFWSSIDKLHPDVLSVEQVDHWNKYFSLCKAMFIADDGMSYGNGQYLYVKP